MINRKEVAKRWREVGERLDKEPPISLTGTACIVLWELLESAGIRDNNSYSDVFNRLADLIDPTCTADIKREDDGIDAQPYYTSSCGNCGALWDTITGAALLPKHCPHCGARVVSDEA